MKLTAELPVSGRIPLEPDAKFTPVFGIGLPSVFNPR